MAGIDAAPMAVYEERRDDAIRLIYEEAEGVRALTPPRRGCARHGGANKGRVVSDHWSGSAGGSGIC